jgi:hypothetical protein
MPDRRRIRLSEGDAMEQGVRCPSCGSYTSFADILATGQCRGVWADDCETELALDLVVERGAETVDTDADG